MHDSMPVVQNVSSTRQLPSPNMGSSHIKDSNMPQEGRQHPLDGGSLGDIEG